MRAPTPSARESVEEIVRGQLSKALGGRRGMVEAAVPTILFTVLWLSTRNLTVALVTSAVAAAVLLGVRLVQRSTIQYCLNALFGIGIGWLFVSIAASRGGDADTQALAYFLPGIIYNTVYTAVLSLTALAGWPLVGFMIGSVTGDATSWRKDRQVVALCSKLTWLLVLPCAIRVAVQLPIWWAAHSDMMAKDRAIALLGILKIAMGWPLTLLFAAAMVWVLNRDSTPVEDSASVHEAVDVSAPAD